MTPEETRDLYRANGYSVVAFTDHWTYVDHSHLSDEGFVALCGYELNYDWRELETSRLFRTCHLCAISKDPSCCTPIPGQGEYGIQTVNEAIRQLNQNGFFVNLNHTSWSAMPTEDILSIEGIAGMELYNATCDSGFQGMAEFSNYSLALGGGKRWLPVAADDNHHSIRCDLRLAESDDCCKAFVMLRAPRLTYQDVVSAYLAGDYYCSTGPLIHALYLEGDRLCIDSSPVSRAFLRTKYITFNDAVVRRHDTLTHVEFDLTPYRWDIPYVLVQLVDRLGGFACTVPYYFKPGC